MKGKMKTFLSVSCLVLFGLSSIYSEKISKTLLFQPGEVYQLEWSRQGIQKISGSSLPMRFEDKENRNYRIKITGVLEDRILLEIILTRHWGTVGDSITGNSRYDSKKNIVPKDARIQISEFVGVPTKFEISLPSLTVNPVGPNQTSSVDSLAQLNFVFNAHKTFSIEEETISGLIEIACDLSAGKSKNEKLTYSCETGNIQEKPSSSEARQGILSILVRSLGPPELTNATSIGEWTYIHKGSTSVSGQVDTNIRYLLGKGTNQEVIWEFSGEIRAKLLRD